MSFDPLNILLLAVALVVFWKLKSVLGTRTGTERPPVEPFEPKKNETATRPEPGTRIIRIPDPDHQNPPPPRLEDLETPVWTGYAETGSPVAIGLERISAVDLTFSPKSFLDGAKLAYEMIIEAFAKGDKVALKGLLNTEVYEGFARAIQARQDAGQYVESRFVGISKSRIVAAVLANSKAALTVEFTSELISATFNSDGTIAEGDPSRIRDVTDTWTFERDLTSQNPNWKLSATQAAT